MQGIRERLQASVRPLPSHTPSNRWLVGIFGALASVAMHAALIQGLLWGDRGHRIHAEPREGLGANQIAADEVATATLIFIEDSRARLPQENSLEQLASAGNVLRNLHMTIVSPDPSEKSAASDGPLDESDSVPSEESAVDREARAALFGRYIGQIHARIERAWLRPRTSIGAESFDCRVQVQQTPRGDIEEVMLENCNGDARWGLSLVRAIERASPLPAPPDPAVFSGRLQLSFRSSAFVPGGSEEGFEQADPSVTGAAR